VVEALDGAKLFTSWPGLKERKKKGLLIASSKAHCKPFGFFFWWYWDLNSGLHGT
jgi:hypothetical protein